MNTKPKEEHVREEAREEHFRDEKWKTGYQRASLTVEAAFVLPLFLYLMIAFLYFIQIFTVQEKIQATITKMGLNLSKSAYILQDFPNTEDMLSFDFTIFGSENELGIDELADSIASDSILKLYAAKDLDIDLINKSCIKGGFDGLDFYGSSLLAGSDYIDIVVNYMVEIPVKIFIVPEMQMIQRAKLRCWTGYEVPAAYQTEEETKETIVFVTETGSVYHKTENCSHIKLSVTAVMGIPTGLRNSNGARYKPCEACCSNTSDGFATYYITTDGTRYHSLRECSKIKRTVREISIKEIGEWTACKRCYK